MDVIHGRGPFTVFSVQFQACGQTFVKRRVHIVSKIISKEEQTELCQEYDKQQSGILNEKEEQIRMRLD